MKTLAEKRNTARTDFSSRIIEYHGEQARKEFSKSFLDKIVSPTFREDPYAESGGGIRYVNLLDGLVKIRGISRKEKNMANFTCSVTPANMIAAILHPELREEVGIDLKGGSYEIFGWKPDTTSTKAQKRAYSQVLRFFGKRKVERIVAAMKARSK